MDNSRIELMEIYRGRLSKVPRRVNRYNPQLVFILNELPQDRDAVILDAGCGNGRYSRALVDMGYRHVYAVDLFENINSEGFYYQQCDIEDLNFKDSFFDFIFSNSVLYYLKSPQKAIAEFHRVLKKGGKVFISGHTKYSLETLWRRIKLRFGFRSVRHLLHASFFSVGEYKKWFKECGFEIVSVDGFGSLSYAVIPLIKALIRIAAVIRLRKLDNDVKIKSTKAMALIRSHLAYHFVIIAKKIS